MPYAIYHVQVGDVIHSDFVTHHKAALPVFTQFLEFVYNLENFEPAASPVELSRWVLQNMDNMSLIELDVLDDIDELIMDKLVSYIDRSKNNDVVRVAQLRHDCIKLANTRLSDTWLTAKVNDRLEWLTEARVVIDILIPSRNSPKDVV